MDVALGARSAFPVIDLANTTEDPIFFALEPTNETARKMVAQAQARAFLARIVTDNLANLNNKI